MTRRVILYAASLIPREKLLSGISTTAYDWERPDTPQNMARPWPDDQAVQIAIRHGSTIRYDEPDETPWFRYTEGNTLREVWFEDARSIMAKFRTIRGAGIGGTGVWHLGARNTQLNTLLSNFFTVQR